MKAFILAAGLGTRLYPLTKNQAKPSLPVCGIPMLWFNAWHLKKTLNISKFAINVGHAPLSLKEAATDKDLVKLTGIHFYFSDESKKILGSSGALWKLKKWIGDNLLAVCNGDCISFPSWNTMLSLHKQKKSLLTLHVRQFKGIAPYTNIKMDSTGLVLSIGKNQKSGLMFSGCYFIEPEILSRIPPGKTNLRETLLDPLIKEKKLYAYHENTPWLDLGALDAYSRAQRELPIKFPQTKHLLSLKN